MITWHIIRAIDTYHVCNIALTSYIHRYSTHVTKKLITTILSYENKQKKENLKMRSHTGRKLQGTVIRKRWWWNFEHITLMPYRVSSFVQNLREKHKKNIQHATISKKMTSRRPNWVQMKKKKSKQRK